MTSASKRLRANGLVSEAIAGLVTGLVATLTDIIPMAVFVFSGSLEPYVAAGIGINLFSSAVIGLVIALRSSFKGIIAFPVAEEMATLAVVLSAIAQQIPSSATESEVLLTIVAAIGLSSVLVGIFLLVVGQLRLGELIRFLPYPVVGGYLAGLGCLMSLGGLQVMADVGTIAQLPMLFQSDLLLRWVPGFAFAVGLLLLTHRYKNVLIIPISFAAVTGLFYGVLRSSQTSIADAFQQRWLLGPFPTGQLWQPTSLFHLSQVNWSLIVSQLPGMFALMLITALSILLVSSGLELVTEQDLDLNRELQTAGVANLCSGLLGGIVGSHTIGATLLANKMGGKTRLTGIIVSGFYLLVLFAGLSLLSFLPRFVAGGALLFIGIPLILSWVYAGWFKLSRIDYAVMLLIAGIVTTVGFIEGVVVGLVAAILLFVLTYSRADVTRHRLSGSSYTSRLRRSPPQERVLRQEGNQTYILQLQGFIFFGTAHKLLRQIRQQLSEQAAIRFLVLDFRLVSGLDSSAVLSFLKLKQVMQQRSLTLVLTSLSEQIRGQFQHEGLLAQAQVFGTLDQGVTWCENQVLEATQFRRRRTLPLALQFEEVFQGNQEEISTFMDCLEAIDLAKGEVLFRQGDRPTGIYFLEYGQISTVLNQTDADDGQRLETLSSGTTVGETEFYAQCAYRATAIADTDSTLHHLSADALHTMQQTHPQLARELGNWMNALLSERLVQAQTEIEILLK